MAKSTPAPLGAAILIVAEFVPSARPAFDKQNVPPLGSSDKLIMLNTSQKAPEGAVNYCKSLKLKA
jgi:hypothetical protein